MLKNSFGTGECCLSNHMGENPPEKNTRNTVKALLYGSQTTVKIWESFWVFFAEFGNNTEYIG